MLSQSFPALKAQSELPNFFYIDDGVVLEKGLRGDLENKVSFLTLDSPERVDLRLALAGLMIDKLKREVPTWGYLLQPKKIIYVDGLENRS